MRPWSVVPGRVDDQVANDPSAVGEGCGLGRAAGPDLTAAGQERGVLLVGIDYLSIASYRDPAPTHEALLRAGVTILESLDLRAVDPGWWTLTCLPLRIPGADGAPARALLSRPPPPDRDR